MAMRSNVHVTSQPARKVSPRCAWFGYSHMPDRSTKWISEMSERVRVKALWKDLLISSWSFHLLRWLSQV